MKPGGIKFESDAVVFRKRSHWLNYSACEYAFLMYWDHLVKIDTALYPISTQRNLAVALKNISMPLNPVNYGRESGLWTNFLASPDLERSLRKTKKRITAGTPAHTCCAWAGGTAEFWRIIIDRICCLCAFFLTYYVCFGILEPNVLGL